MKKSSYSLPSKRKLRYTAAACVLVLSIGLSACGGEEAIDAPPADVQAEMMRSTEGNASGVSGGTSFANDPNFVSNITVYALDRNGYLAPVSYNLDAKDPNALAKAGIDMLTEGSSSASKLPDGFTGLFPQGTQVLNVSLQPEQKLAVVELSKEFKNYKPEQERRILESLTWTLTSIPEVKQVQLWMDAQKLTEMPVNGIPLDENLTRSYGINLEKQEGVSYTNSMPVTLYFTSLTMEGKPYYVPVTRLITPTDDPVQAALAQLIKGPLDERSMSKVATDGTKIENAVHQGDTVTVDMSDSMFEQGEKVPSDLMKSVILSLTELPNVSKVQVSINGMKDIRDSEDTDYSQPVSRPVVNQAVKG